MADFTYGAGKMDEPNTFCGTRMLRDLKIKLKGACQRNKEPICRGACWANLGHCKYQNKYE